ncbi:MAG TPA: VOC family protein [Kribbella sp.]
MLHPADQVGRQIDVELRLLGSFLSHGYIASILDSYKSKGSMVDEVTPHGGTLLQFSSDDVRADIEEIRSRGGNIVLEPTDTDWGTLSACVAGPHNVLVELYKFTSAH